MTEHADLEQRLRAHAKNCVHAHVTERLLLGAADALASLTRERDEYVLVPVQMTPEMARAFARHWHDNWRHDHVFEDTPANEMWRDVLDAALLSRAASPEDKA